MDYSLKTIKKDKTMCKVTVVIPNYKGEKYLLPCLESVYEMTGIPVHVIVVDNGSTDSCIEKAKERYPQTEFICFRRTMLLPCGQCGD